MKVWIRKENDRRNASSWWRRKKKAENKKKKTKSERGIGFGRHLPMQPQALITATSKKAMSTYVHADKANRAHR